MNNLTKEIHLRNMISCLTDIEDSCADLTYRQLEDGTFMKSLQLDFALLGLEAANSAISDPVVEVLKSFLHMDLEEDKYALYHFIINDLGMIKSSIRQMQAPRAGKKGITAAGTGLPLENTMAARCL